MKNEVDIGTILISKPFMEDKRFEKTIILIVEVSSEGTVGFIINKETTQHVDIIIEDCPKLNINVKYGGPVSTDNVFYIHQNSDLKTSSQEVKAGIFWGGELDDVIKRHQSGTLSIDEISFFLGYTGWEKNQLEEEIQEGSWIISNMHLTQINKNLDWSQLLIDVNKEYEVWAKAPSNFHLN